MKIIPKTTMYFLSNHLVRIKKFIEGVKSTGEARAHVRLWIVDSIEVDFRNFNPDGLYPEQHQISRSYNRRLFASSYDSNFDKYMKNLITSKQPIWSTIKYQTKTMVMGSLRECALPFVSSVKGNKGKPSLQFDRPSKVSRGTLVSIKMLSSLWCKIN